MWTGRVKRAVTVWHRRSGKDTTWLNLTIAMMPQRVGTYIHLFPELKRGRKILWEGKNRDGMPFLEHFPPGFVKRKREDEMLIECVNGSAWRVEGVENLNSVVGMNPIGIVYSEFSQMRPGIRDLISPILDENGGWEAYNFTPRGRNHAFDLYQMARQAPDWYASLLTVDDTRRDAPGEDGGRVITPEQIDQRRREGAREPWILQEYFCSFEAGSALQFIPPDYVQTALAREALPAGWAPMVAGVDVGRNRDRAVILLRQGGLLLEKLVLHPYQLAFNPTEILCGRLARLIEAYHPAAVFVDGVGIGAGVVDRMHSLGYTVLSVLGNSAPPDPAYVNLRAYMWGQMREWLRTEGCLDRTRDQTLAAELQWPQWRWKGDKEWLTPKDELEGDDDQLEYASPDEADALSLTFAAPVTPRAQADRRPGRQAELDYDPLRYDSARPRAVVARTEWDPRA